MLTFLFKTFCIIVMIFSHLEVRQSCGIDAWLSFRSDSLNPDSFILKQRKQLRKNRAIQSLSRWKKNDRPKSPYLDLLNSRKTQNHYWQYFDRMKKGKYDVNISDLINDIQIKVRSLAKQELFSKKSTAIKGYKCLYFSVFNKGKSLSNKDIGTISFEINSVMTKLIEEYSFLFILNQYDFDCDRVEDQKIRSFFKNMCAEKKKMSLQQEKVEFRKKYDDLCRFLSQDSSDQNNMRDLLNAKYKASDVLLSCFDQMWSSSHNINQYLKDWDRYFQKNIRPMRFLSDALLLIFKMMLGNDYILETDHSWRIPLLWMIHSPIPPHDYKKSDQFAKLLENLKKKNKQSLEEDPLLISCDKKLTHFSYCEINSNLSPFSAQVILESSSFPHPVQLRGSFHDIEILCEILNTEMNDIFIMVSKIPFYYFDKSKKFGSLLLKDNPYVTIPLDNSSDFFKIYLKGLLYGALFFKIVVKEKDSKRIFDTGTDA